MTESVLNCWSNILKKVKGSKLIIKCANKKLRFDRIEKHLKKWCLKLCYFPSSN